MDVSCQQESLNQGTSNFKKLNIVMFAVVGVALNVVEILSYAVLFCHIGRHNEAAADILDATTVKNRRRVNAVSLVGLFAGWVMEFWYLALLALLFLVLESNWILQLSAILKLFEFYFIPLVQLNSSAPLKRFVDQRKSGKVS